jgi:hypothetical protein
VSWFWLSFCDPKLPKGSQFLGACIVEGDDTPQAVENARKRGLNPGGEVVSVSADPATIAIMPEKWKNRLLTREERRHPARLLRAHRALREVREQEDRAWTSGMKPRIEMPIVRVEREHGRDFHVKLNGFIIATFDVHKDALWFARLVRSALRSR